MTVAGLGLVVNDFRFNGFDLIPDLLGWGVVLVGLTKLAGRSPWFTAARVAAAFGVLLGIPLLIAEPGRVLSTVEGIVLCVVVFGTCTAIGEIVERTRATANLIRWSFLTLTVVALLVSVLVGPTEVSDGGVPVLVLAVLVAFALLAWFLVFLWTNRTDPALGAPSSRIQPDPVL